MDAEDRRSHAGAEPHAPVGAVEAAEARGSRLVHGGVPVSLDADGTVLVTIPNAAKLTHQGVRTIYNWISRGLVEVRLTPTGHKRVVVSSLFKTQETAAPVPAAEESTT